MNKFIHMIIVAAVAGTFATGCNELDNFDPPSSQLSGNLTYNGKAIGLSQSQFSFDLFESGWDFEQEIPLSIDQNGGFASLLFNGNYRMAPNGGEPFTLTAGVSDISFVLEGNKSMDIEVLPFIFIDEEGVNYSVSGNTLTATFSIEQVDNTKSLDQVGLYVSNELICDATTSEASFEVSSSSLTDLNDIELTVDITDLKSRGYLFVRVGANAAGQEFNYSIVQQVTF